MPEKELRQLLDQLHDELGTTQEIKEETRDSMRTIVSELETLLGEGTQPDEAIGGRIQEAAISFESEHPLLAHIVRQVSRTLARMGI